MSEVGEPSPVTRPYVIVLNGTGSVGKTSTAKALQAIANAPLLHVQMDSFLEMLPAAMFGHSDGYTFRSDVDEEGKPIVEITSGPVLARLFDGMRHAIAAMVKCGNNVVVDDVMFCGGEADEYRRLLIDHELRLVKLTAALDVVEQRELARGDREIGLARWQYDRVHAGIRYDLELDTTRMTPAEVALAICQAFDL